MLHNPPSFTTKVMSYRKENGHPKMTIFCELIFALSLKQSAPVLLQRSIEIPFNNQFMKRVTSSSPFAKEALLNFYARVF